MRLNLRSMVPAWWTVVAGLCAALVSIIGTSYAAGQRLAILDELRPALQQLRQQERDLAVLDVKVTRNSQEIALCCSPRRASAPPPPETGPLLWASGDAP